MEARMREIVKNDAIENLGIAIDCVVIARHLLGQVGLSGKVALLDGVERELEDIRSRTKSDE